MQIKVIFFVLQNRSVSYQLIQSPQEISIIQLIANRKGNKNKMNKYLHQKIHTKLTNSKLGSVFSQIRTV